MMVSMSFLPFKKRIKKTNIVWDVAEAVPLILSVVLAVFGAVCIFFLLIGHFESELIWPVGIILSIPTALYTFKIFQETERAGSVIERRWMIVLLWVMVFAWMGVNAKFSSSHVLINRDPATYTITGEWLINHDNLHIPMEKNFDTNWGLRSDSGGFGVNTDTPDELFAQGAHLLPAFIGLIGRVVGREFVLNLNVAFGGVALLTLFALARLIVKPRWALVSVAVMAVNLPLIYFSRDTYTEPLALIFTFGALALAITAYNTRRKLLWFIAGITLGAGAFARIDAWLSIAAILVPIFVILILSKRKERTANAWQSLAFIGGVAVASVLGLLDVRLLSSGYFFSQLPQIRPELILVLLILLLGTAATALVWWKKNLLKRVDKSTKGWRGKAIFWCVIFVWVILAARPLFIHGMDDDAQDTVNWLVWYIGPLSVLIGAVGSALIAKRILTTENIALTALFAVVMATALLYLIYPSIAPDQIWASRRMLPVVMPGLVVMAVWLLQYIYENFSVIKLSKFRISLESKKLVCVVATVLVMSPMLITFPFTNKTPFAEYQGAQAFCRAMPSNAAVLWLGLARREAVMFTRTLCDFPSVGFYGDTYSDQKPSQKQLIEYANLAKSKGRTPIVAFYAQDLQRVATSRDKFTSVVDIQFQNIEVVKGVFPNEMTQSHDLLMAGRVLPNGTVVPITAVVESTK